MSKRPVSPEGGGGAPPSRARGPDAATSPPGTGRVRKASERQAAAAGALRDGGAGTSAAAMAARAGDRRHVTLVEPSQYGGRQPQQQQVAQQYQYQGDGRAGAPQPAAAGAGRRRPTYVPPSERRREQPPVIHHGGPYPQGGSIPEEHQQAMLLPPGGAAPPPAGAGGAGPPRRKRSSTATPTLASDMPVPGSSASDARRHSRPRQQAPGDEATARPAGILATAGGRPAAPHGGRPTGPEGPRVAFLPTATERYGPEAAPAAPGQNPLPPSPPPHAADGAHNPQQPTTAAPQYHQPPYGNKWQQQAGRPSPMQPTERWRRKEKKKKPLAFLFTLCCILFWLLVVCIGLAILVIYLIYHPKPPRLHVSTATLNAGYVDELPPPHLGAKALNSDLYVLAAIYNPNSKIDVVLHYMQFDLYFQGHLIGTQAVWPPLYERPGDSELRSVHLVVSEVVMRPEDADVWRNATTMSGGLVQMQLEGRFYVQLNFGRWLPFRYMVKPSCALWLDPPPAGALRRARCRQ